MIPAGSPGIGYVDGAYRVGSDGDCVNSGSDGIMHDSYGTLRTSLMVFTVHIMLRTLVILTTATIGLTHIPTGSSPITNWNGIAFCVIPSGGFDDNIVDYVDSRSYGRSPGLDNLYDIYAHNVDSYGNISNYAKPNNTVTDSCGVK